MAGGADESVPKDWERPWSVDEMRKSAGNWSLASDAGMLQYLQEFSQKMTSRTHAIQEEVNGLVHELKLSGVRVSNVFNDFIMLANTQFVENRVYDEDVHTEEEEKKNEEPEKSKEQREAELIPRISEAIIKGMSVMDSQFEKLDVNEGVSDSEEEDMPYKADPILEPKDPYINRPLPHLIGTPAFYQTDDVGLVEELSDKEESVAETESESEESETESEGESDRSASPQIKRHSFHSSESESETGSDLFGEEKEPEEEYLSASEKSDAESEKEVIENNVTLAKPASFADELSAKLGGGQPPAKTKKKRDRKTSEKKENVNESVNDDLFGSSNKFEDDGDDDVDDEFGNENGLFSTKGGLFDDEPVEGGLFGDNQDKPEKKKSSVPADEKSEKETKSKSKKSTKSKTVAPTFDASDQEDDLFGGSLKSNTSKSKPSIPKDTSGLFEEGSDDDLFASLSTAKDTKPASGAAAQTKPKAKTSLLVDSDEESDLFSDNQTPKPLSRETSVEPEFTTAEQSHKKKLPAGAVSMFGGAQNPFAAAIKSKQKPENSESEEEKGWSDDEKVTTDSTDRVQAVLPPSLAPEPAPAVTSSGGLFDDEDDLFGGGSEKVSKPSASNVKTKAEKPAPAATLLFGGDDEEEEDLFSSLNKPTKKEVKQPVKKEPSPPKSKTLLLSGDVSDEDDLFGSTPAQPQKKKPVGGVSIFGDAFTMPVAEATKSPVHTPEPVRQKKSSLSLFDAEDGGEEGDLFGGGMPSSALTPPPKQKSNDQKAKSAPLPAAESTLESTPAPAASDKLFGASDNLFGSSPEEDDLFKPSKPKSRSSQPVVSKAKTSRPVASTRKIDSSDEEDDLFKTLPVKTVPIHNTSVQRPPAPSKARKTKLPQVPKVEKNPTVLKPDKVKSYIQDEPATDPLGLGPPVGITQSTSSTQQKKPPPRAGSGTGPTISIVQPTGPPGKSTGVAKTKATLNINPAALLPGAKPPGKEVEAAPVSFEEDINADTLEHLGKSRAKIQSKRRPPSRRSRAARQDSNEGSQTPSDPSFSSPLTAPHNHIDPAFDRPVTSTGSTDVKPSSSQSADKAAELFAGEEDDLFAVKQLPQQNADPLLAANDFEGTVTPKEPVKVAHQPSKQKDSHFDTKPILKTEPQANTGEARSAADDTDHTTTHGVKSEPTAVKVERPPADDLFDDPFRESIAKTKDLFGKSTGATPSNVDDDLFGSSSGKSKSTTRLPATLAVDDEDDLFKKKSNAIKEEVTTGASLKNQSKAADKKLETSVSFMDDDDDEDDIFGSKPPPFPEGPGSSSPPDDDGDDLFGIPNSISSKVPPTMAPVSSEDDIFGRSTAKIATPLDTSAAFSDTLKPGPPPIVDEDDIFSRNSKPVVKKSENAATLDDEDIFGSAPKSEPRKSKKVVPTKDEDLFADDTDIFADAPPMKPKEKKKMPKAGSLGKSIFKDDVDDIFADVSSKPKKTSKKTVTTKKAVASTESSNIFDDPLQDDIFK